MYQKQISKINPLSISGLLGVNIIFTSEYRMAIVFPDLQISYI